MKETTLSIAQSLTFTTVVAVTACGGHESNALVDGAESRSKPTTETLNAETQLQLETEKASTVVALQVGDEKVLIKSVSGGEVVGDALAIPASYEAFRAEVNARKHIGNVKYEDFSLQVPLPLSPAVGAWISEFFSAHAPRRSGAIVTCENDFKTCQTREFYDALITEVGMPACDGAAKDAAFMSLKFTPEYTRSKKGDGKIDSPVAMDQKTFEPANFRFTIDGLDTAKVTKIDAITVKQSVVTDEIGEVRDYEIGPTKPGYTKEPGKIDFPNIKVTMSEEYAQDFFGWYDDFVIKGNNDESKHKTGSLALLDTTRTSDLLTVRFEGIGIFKVYKTPSTTNNDDKIASVTAEMYVENIVAKFSEPRDGGL